MQRIKTRVEKNGDSDIFDYNYSRIYIDTTSIFLSVSIDGPNSTWREHE